MYRVNKTLLLLLIGQLMIGQTTLLQAQPETGSSQAADSASQNAVISEEEAKITRRQASDLATEAYAGRLLNIRFDAGHWVLRMDHNGTVFNVRVDALSGELIGPYDEEADTTGQSTP